MQVVIEELCQHACKIVEGHDLSYAQFLLLDNPLNPTILYLHMSSFPPIPLRYAIAKAADASLCIVASSSIPRSLAGLQRDIACCAHLVMTYHSVLAELGVTVDWVLVHDFNIAVTHIKAPPDVDRTHGFSPAQSESAYPARPPMPPL